MGDYIAQIKEAVITMKGNEIENLVKIAIDDGVSLNKIMNDALIAAMDVIGNKFSDNEIFVPEMLLSAKIMKKGLDLIKPHLNSEEIISRGTVLLCTVKGDMHDIGKNIVGMMLEGAGFRVIDLGVDLSKEEISAQVEEIKPDILGLSALLTTTMPEMKNIIEELETKGLKNSIGVLIGGAPVTAEYAAQIGADGYGKDAAEAVELSRNLYKTK